MSELPELPANETTAMRSIEKQLTESIPFSDVISKINQLMNATRTMRNGEEAIDTRAVEVGVKLYLSYVEGLPIQRTESIVRNIDESEAAFMKRIKSSPHLRQALRRALDEAEADPIDV